MVRFVIGLWVLLASASFAQEGRCDPHGVDLPEFFAPSVPIEHELFPDELAARGTCFPPGRSIPLGSDVSTLLVNAEREAVDACDGVCEPMRKRLVTLGEDHDLEDTTFQKECGAAASGLPAAVKDPCLRVCVVERRRASARLIFLRTVRALDLSLPWRKPTRLGTEVREWLKRERVAAPPSPIRLEVSGPEHQRSVRAEGWLYPGGPRLRLETRLVAAGCGLTQWGIARW